MRGRFSPNVPQSVARHQTQEESAVLTNALIPMLLVGHAAQFCGEV